MTDLAKWRPGQITKDWQRRIVEGNERRAIQTINGLCAIVFETSPGMFEEQCRALESLTGAQIAEQLRSYWAATQKELTMARDLPKEAVDEAASFR